MAVDPFKRIVCMQFRCNLYSVRKSGSLRILYLVCAVCVVNAILSPAVRSGISRNTELKSQPARDGGFFLDFFSLTGEAPDDERDQTPDDDDYVQFDLLFPDNFSCIELALNKIPSQEGLLDYPSFSKFKPPPQA